MDITMEVGLPRTRPVRTYPRVLAGLRLKRKIRDSQAPFWNLVFLVSCVTAILLDPLFLYIPVINDKKKCLGLDKNWGTALIFVRSFFDFFHFMYIIFQLHAHFLRNLMINRRGFLKDRSWEIARKYFLYDFPIDILSILPLPQGVIGVLIRGWKIRNPMKLLQYFVLMQYVPRLIRLYPLFRKVKRTSRNLYDSTVTKVAFNLLLYMLASHVYGSLWYFLAIERETVCWKRACVNPPGCSRISIYCRDVNLGDFALLDNLCPTKQPNTTVFDFGIYQDALQSGIVEVTDLPQKFLYSFVRGLQILSSLGQNLRTSSSIWENFFAVLVILSGWTILLYLIGNVQIYLQSRNAKAEEMRLKGQEIEQWNGFRKLSDNLQHKVRKYRQYVWRETRGFDVENLIKNLPRDLRSGVKSQLGLDLIKKVPLFASMPESLLNDLCDGLKPMVYTEDSYFVREGHPVDEMLFVMQGKLSSVATDGGRAGFYNACYVRDGDCFGDVLISWALNLQSSNDLPISTRTVRALTKVEALVLKADDLKFVVSQFRPATKQQEHLYSYYAGPKRSDAARLIQQAWHKYKRR
ncbi:cyclic nucleotide-gated ion channel 1-like [Mangifera indica]|uniref:cyclic nucleotide-gated ion channel 1-like n=1 Tax=Mangifera indica TaxID=29780 RepID=UPI001CF98954|nr:cyclic nucleotide-gated ion channel 1-like [Mangifera indica]